MHGATVARSVVPLPSLRKRQTLGHACARCKYFRRNLAAACTCRAADVAEKQHCLQSGVRDKGSKSRRCSRSPAFFVGEIKMAADDSNVIHGIRSLLHPKEAARQTTAAAVQNPAKPPTAVSAASDEPLPNPLVPDSRQPIRDPMGMAPACGCPSGTANGPIVAEDRPTAEPAPKPSAAAVKAAAKKPLTQDAVVEKIAARICALVARQGFRGMDRRAT